MDSYLRIVNGTRLWFWKAAGPEITGSSLATGTTSLPARWLHRLDGPALEFSDGRKEWYVRGQFVRELDPPAPRGPSPWGPP